MGSLSNPGVLFSWTMLICGMLISLLVVCPASSSDTPKDVNIKVVQNWANALSEQLNKTSHDQSGIGFLRAAYKKKQSELNIRTILGTDIRDAILDDITYFLKKKVRAVEKIRNVTEAAFKNYDYSSEPPNDYLYALGENISSEIDLPRDYEKSTIHVPTVVYREDNKLLEGVSATDKLDKTFQENARKNPALVWQYFGSTTGFMRNYPGVVWETKDDLNLFDARHRIWYSQTIASPKTVLFLVDMSGSQTGLSISMTKLMINHTIDTLGDNDFFNIVTFNDTRKFLDDCYEDTFVQATYENKEHMKSLLNEVAPEEVSDVCDAFAFAFDTLARFRDNADSGCNEMIMLFTDGVEFTCDTVFDQRNANKSVRVFTYLLGESVQHERILQDIACNNHGKYTRISVRSDVVEKVADYLPVLGRPLAQQGSNPSIWTNSYEDFQNGNLVITVSQPVHNTTAQGKKGGQTLGIASVDIALDSILEFAAPYKFGVNGYFFMTTNNGYITYHPRQRFRYLQTGYEIKGTSTQDITDVEQSTEFKDLRTSMINGVPSSVVMRTEVPLEDMKRIQTRTVEYFYASVKSSYFSLAAVIDDDGDSNINPPEIVTLSDDGELELSGGQYTSLLENVTGYLNEARNMIILADWVPCHTRQKEDVVEPSPEDLVSTLLDELQNNKMQTVYCAPDWLNLFLLDWRISSGFLTDWDDQYQEQNITVTRFLATTGGLNLEKLTDSEADRYTMKYSRTLAEDYYSRAVYEVTDLGFIYSVPFKNLTTEVNLDPDEDLMTAYSAVRIGGKTVAVSGYQMTLSELDKIFKNVTEMVMEEGCSSLGGGDPNQCYHTCEKQGVVCCLIDLDGYILASTDKSQIGEHIGKAKTDLFHHLIGKDVFEEGTYVDHQATCIKSKAKEPSSAWMLLNPLSQVKNLMLLLFHRAFMIWMTFSWYEWMSVFAAPPNITQMMGPEHYEPCDLEYPFYKLTSPELEKQGTISEECYNSSYKIVWVAQSNLALLVEVFGDSMEPKEPQCVDKDTYSLKPQQVNYTVTEEDRCDAFWMPRDRKAPETCVTSTNDSKALEVDECSGCSLRPSWMILALLILYHISRLVS